VDITKAANSLSTHQTTTQSPVLAWLSSQSQFSLDKAETIELLSQEFEIQDYQLGEEILAQPSTNSTDNNQYLFTAGRGHLWRSVFFVGTILSLQNTGSKRSSDRSNPPGKTRSLPQAAPRIGSEMAGDRSRATKTDFF
jgi:hypothetical protein